MSGTPDSGVFDTPGSINANPETVRSLVPAWAELWEVPGLEDDLVVSFSPRLERTLGRCRPATGRITLRADLRDGPPDRLAEVLCHEAAHVAVYRKYGAAARAHGPEWKQFVTAAGYEPRVRVPPSGYEPHVRVPPPGTQTRVRVPPSGPSARRSRSTEGLPGATSPTPRLPYEHRCPVCHAVRYARRPVPRWRCTECLDAGLGGEMVITRRSDA